MVSAARSLVISVRPTPYPTDPSTFLDSTHPKVCVCMERLAPAAPSHGWPGVDGYGDLLPLLGACAALGGLCFMSTRIHTNIEQRSLPSRTTRSRCWYKALLKLATTVTVLRTSLCTTWAALSGASPTRYTTNDRHNGEAVVRTQRTRRGQLSLLNGPVSTTTSINTLQHCTTINTKRKQ